MKTKFYVNICSPKNHSEVSLKKKNLIVSATPWVGSHKKHNNTNLQNNWPTSLTKLSRPPFLEITRVCDQFVKIITPESQLQ
jgi:hypothetical protein